VRRRAEKFTVVLASILLTAAPMVSHAQNDPAEQQIGLLMSRLSAHANPEELLDPSLSSERRQEQARYFANTYEISLVPEGPIQFTSQAAAVPARLTFKTSSATSNEEKEYSTKLTFVLRDGQWYFASYDFLKTTVGGYLAFWAGLLVAVVWGGGAWLKLRSLRKRRMGTYRIPELFADYFQSVNPVTWFRRESTRDRGREHT